MRRRQRGARVCGAARLASRRLYCARLCAARRRSCAPRAGDEQRHFAIVSRRRDSRHRCGGLGQRRRRCTNSRPHPFARQAIQSNNELFVCLHCATTHHQTPSVPAFAHHDLVSALAPHLKPGAWLVALPGQGGFDLTCEELLGKERIAANRWVLVRLFTVFYYYDFATTVDLTVFTFILI